MSDSLPLITDTWIEPWLMYRHHHEVVGTLPLSSLPNLQASQNKEQGQAAVHIAVKQRQDGQVVITGNAEIELLFDCQRCLQPLLSQIKAVFELVIVKFEQQLSNVDEADDAIVCEERLEIAPLIEQELILALPMIAKHSDCQADYNNRTNESTDRQYPFANLKDLI